MNLIARSDTPADIRRIKLMIRSIARQMKQNRARALDPPDEAWMENRPALLWLLGSASIRVIVVLLDGWNGDWADVA